MTIREKLLQQLKLYLLGVVGLTGVFAGAMVLTHFGFPHAWFIALVAFSAIGFVFYMRAIYLCPRCNSKLLGIVGWCGLTKKEKERMHFCPYCGVRFDDPVSGTRGQK